MSEKEAAMGGKLDEYPDGKHFLRAARIAIEQGVVPMAKALGPLSMLERDIPWDVVCPQDKPADAQPGER